MYPDLYPHSDLDIELLQITYLLLMTTQESWNEINKISQRCYSEKDLLSYFVLCQILSNIDCWHWDTDILIYIPMIFSNEQRTLYDQHRLYFLNDEMYLSNKLIV